jgi:uncharacterized radical SAM protein YgiQ
MLKAVRELPAVKNVFIRSGIRYDLVLADRENGQRFIEALAADHVSGILKVAPEHTVQDVLSVMRKPAADKYEIFAQRFRAADDRVCRAPRKPQYLLPYFISAHPGCRLEDAAALSEYIDAHGGFVPDQIQDFYPTPGTLATCIYHTGRDPFTGAEIYIPGKNPDIPDERKLQRALLHRHKPENKAAYLRALSLLGKTPAQTRKGKRK